jgi:hypothetical protein
MKVLVRAALVCGVAFAALSAVTHASARVACTPGVVKKGGVTYRTFCGPAHATIKYGGKTYSFKGGSCGITSLGWGLNIGTAALGNAKPKYDYFGVAVIGKKKPGTYKHQTVAWSFSNGTRGALRGATVTLKSGLKSGSFVGTVMGAGGPASGTFSCS